MPLADPDEPLTCKPERHNGTKAHRTARNICRTMGQRKAQVGLGCEPMHGVEFRHAGGETPPAWEGVH
jgi:hypothetical protein